jgi:hypothetical protein
MPTGTFFRRAQIYIALGIHHRKLAFRATNLIPKNVVPGQREKDWHSALCVYRDQPRHVHVYVSLRALSLPARAAWPPV